MTKQRRRYAWHARWAEVAAKRKEIIHKAKGDGSFVRSSIVADRRTSVFTVELDCVSPASSRGVLRDFAHQISGSESSRNDQNCLLLHDVNHLSLSPSCLPLLLLSFSLYIIIPTSQVTLTPIMAGIRPPVLDAALRSCTRARRAPALRNAPFSRRTPAIQCRHFGEAGGRPPTPPGGGVGKNTVVAPKTRLAVGVVFIGALIYSMV